MEKLAEWSYRVPEQSKDFGDRKHQGIGPLVPRSEAAPLMRSRRLEVLCNPVGSLRLTVNLREPLLKPAWRVIAGGGTISVSPTRRLWRANLDQRRMPEGPCRALMAKIRFNIIFPPNSAIGVEGERREGASGQHSSQQRGYRRSRGIEFARLELWKELWEPSNGGHNMWLLELNPRPKTPRIWGVEAMEESCGSHSMMGLECRAGRRIDMQESQRTTMSNSRVDFAYLESLRGKTEQTAERGNLGGRRRFCPEIGVEVLRSPLEPLGLRRPSRHVEGGCPSLDSSGLSLAVHKALTWLVTRHVLRLLTFSKVKSSLMSLVGDDWTIAIQYLSLFVMDDNSFQVTRLLASMIHVLLLRRREPNICSVYLLTSELIIFMVGLLVKAARQRPYLHEDVKGATWGGVSAMHRVSSTGNTSNLSRPRKERRLTYVLNDANDSKHHSGINCLATPQSLLPADNNFLFSGSRDGMLKRWELAEDSAVCSATFESHVDWVYGGGRYLSHGWIETNLEYNVLPVISIAVRHREARAES
eukprot:Gb_04177 [translate_table: standard]